MRIGGAWFVACSVACGGGCLAIAGLDGDYSVGATDGGAGGASSSAKASSSSGPTPGSGGNGVGGGGGATTGQGTAGGSAGGSAGSGGMPGPECGNLVPEPGEECDDGNKMALDGCSPTCTNEDTDSCTAAPVIFLADMQLLTVSGDTTGAADDITTATNTGTCNAATWPGGDHVYALVPLASGVLRAQLNASYSDHLLHVRAACPGTTDLGCDWSFSASTPDSFNVNVTMGQTYFVIVDSWNNTSGAYTLEVQLN